MKINEQRIPQIRFPGFNPLAIIGILFSIAIGLSLLFSLLKFTAILIAPLILLCIILNPYIGLILFLFYTYLQPPIRFPALTFFRFAYAIALLTGIGWLGHIALKKQKLVQSHQNWAILSFFSAMVLSVVNCFWLQAWYDGIINIGKIIILYFFIANLVNSLSKLKGCILSILILNCYLAVESISGVRSYKGEGFHEIGSASGSGMLGGQDSFGLAMNLMIPYSYFLLMGSKSIKSRLFYLFLLTSYALAAIFTGSRGAFVGIAFIGFLLWLKSKRKIAGLVIIVILSIAIFLVAKPEYWKEMGTIKDYNQGTALERMDMWKRGFSMFLSSPLTGVGIDNFIIVQGSIYGLWKVAHSIYITVIAEMGLLGIISFFFILYFFFKDIKETKVILKSKGDTSSFLYQISEALPLSLIAFLVCGAFLSVLYYEHLYIIIALSVALKEVAKREGNYS